MSERVFVREGIVAASDREIIMDKLWLPTLNTSTPQEGFELAVKLSRLGMMVSQSHNDAGKGSRPVHRHDRAQLIAAAHVIALNFQTIAAANEWWRHPGTNTE
jgi:hypothetical protein